MPSPPGPTQGITLAQARQLQRDTLGFMQQATAAYGDFVRYPIGFWEVYLLNHPDTIQHVLLDNVANYGRATFQFSHFARVTGEGLLTLDGERWLSRRRLAQPAFHRRYLGALSANMSAEIAAAVARWRPLAGQPFNIDAALLQLALAVVWRALFGQPLTAAHAGLAHEILALMDYVVYRSQNLLAPPTAIPTGRNRAFKRRLRALDSLVYGQIHQRRAAPTAAPDDLLGMLLASRTAEGEPLSDGELRDEIVTLIIAGYETVATGMGWLLHLLSQHEAVQAAVRAELNTVLNGRSPTLDDLPSLPFTRQVIDEALRLYPPSWLLTRRALAADTVGGYAIPANALVVISPYVIHRHPAFWPQPDRFDPSRFEAERVRARPKFAYIPFGGGPHLCIGNHFALLELQLMLVAVVQNFTLAPVAERPVQPRPLVTIRPQSGPQSGLWLRLHPIPN